MQMSLAENHSGRSQTTVSLVLIIDICMYAFLLVSNSNMCILLSSLTLQTMYARNQFDVNCVQLVPQYANAGHGNQQYNRLKAHTCLYTCLPTYTCRSGIETCILLQLPFVSRLKFVIFYTYVRVLCGVQSRGSSRRV